MIIPIVVMNTTADKDSQASKAMTNIVVALIFLLYVVAIYLAVRDMKYLPQTSTKIWILLLALLFPDLYCIFHGLSSSSQGVAFFAGTPITSLSGGGGASIMMPETLGSTNVMMTPPSTLSAGSSSLFG